MSTDIRSSVVVAVCLLTQACSGPQQPARTPAGNVDRLFDVEQAQQDLRSGKLTFEIRGLTNDAAKAEYGTTFRHSAVVVPVGESKYSKGTYWLLCSVKRVGGGDPEATRPEDDYALVLVRDGIGRLRESGGYRTRSEKWEPERIEVRPISVLVGIPVDGPPVQEANLAISPPKLQAAGGTAATLSLSPSINASKATGGELGRGAAVGDSGAATAESKDGVYRIGGGVSSPVAIYKVEPEYSEEARKAKLQGTVVLSIVIDGLGIPTKPNVIRPLGSGLDEKAIEAVQKWRFTPGKKDGHAVAVLATVEVNFRLL